MSRRSARATTSASVAIVMQRRAAGALLITQERHGAIEIRRRERECDVAAEERFHVSVQRVTVDETIREPFAFQRIEKTFEQFRGVADREPNELRYPFHSSIIRKKSPNK